MQPEEEEAQVLPDPPQADEAAPQAKPRQPLAADEQPRVASQEDVRLIADSDAENVPPARVGDDGSSDEDAEQAPGRIGGKSAKAAVVKRPAAGSAVSEDPKPAPKRRRVKQPAEVAVVETAAKGSDENSKPAPKRKSKQPARAAPKRRRKSSVDAD